MAFSVKTKARAFIATIHIENMKKAGLSDEDIKKPDRVAEKFTALWESSGTNRTCGIAVCLSKDGCYHAHMALYSCNSTTLANVAKILYNSHVEPQIGGKKSLKSYLEKSGKYAEKDEQVLYTMGLENIKDNQGSRSDLTALYRQIKDGLSDYEILEANADNMRYLAHIGRVRQSIVYEETKNSFRQLNVTYIWGKTGVGKTRSVMEKYGYSNVYRITDYKHPFDGYDPFSHDVILLEEFNSSIGIGDALNLLDGYPLELGCRYHNKWANFHTAILVSNIPLAQQYMDIQRDKPEVWNAFLRRINHVQEFKANGVIVKHSIEEYKKYVPSEEEAVSSKNEQVNIDEFKDIDDTDEKE